MMATQRKPRGGYGGTSEQRQRNLEGDGFEERAPRTPEELEAARGSPEKDGHEVAHLDLLPRQVVEDDED